MCSIGQGILEVLISYDFSLELTGYQYFINSKGVPVSRDWFVHEYVPKSNKTRISCSYYYQYLYIIYYDI